jgi:hypothetical protein
LQRHKSFSKLQTQNIIQGTCFGAHHGGKARQKARAISRLVASSGVMAAALAMALSLPVRAAEPALPVVPAVQPIPVKVMVIANFEPGADTGDAPGEFQLWAEREHLDEVIPVRGTLHPCAAMPRASTAWCGATRIRWWSRLKCS